MECFINWSHNSLPSFRPVVLKLGSPDVLGLQFPEAFTTCFTGQDFWELHFKNIWGPQFENHWFRWWKLVRVPDMWFRQAYGWPIAKERELKWKLQEVWRTPTVTITYFVACKVFLFLLMVWASLFRGAYFVHSWLLKPVLLVFYEQRPILW